MSRIRDTDIRSVVDHGIFRGKRTWTVNIEQDGRNYAVNVTDVDNAGLAIGKAKTIMDGAPKVSEEARQALRQQSDALNGLL